MKLHWGNALVIFFVIFLSLAAIFIVFSLKQNHDMEDEGYYKKGASYSKQIEINKRSNQYIDSIIIQQDSNTVKILFSNNLVSHSQKMHLHFYRPSNEKYDYQTNIKKPAKIYIVDKSKLTKGRYIVKFTWRMDAVDYALNQELFIE